MPIYNLNNRVYDIPDDVVKEFENENPTATLAYQDGEDIYDIQVNQRDEFLKQFPKAKLYVEQPTEEDPFETNQKRFQAGEPIQRVSTQSMIDANPELNLQDDTQGFNQEVPQSEIERLKQIRDKAQFVIDTSSFLDRFFDADTSAAVAARNQAEEALETYEEANREKETWFDRNVVGVVNGIVDKATDLSTWDFGASGVASAKALNDAYNKLKNGEKLSVAEQNMLDAYGLASAVQTAYQDKVGMAYRIGGSLPESVGFMASFALNPLGGSGKKIAETAAKAAVKKYGTSLVSKLAKGAARVGGDVVEMAAATAIPGAGRVAEDYYNRLNGQSTFDIDSNGIIRYGGQMEQEEADDAIWKAFGSQFIENYSEAMGNYFAPMGRMLSNLTSKGLKAAHLGKFADLVNDISSAQFSRGIQRFKEATKFDGLIGEYLEEVAGNMMNAATVGDMNFNSPDDPRSVFNPETNVKTFLSCSLMSGTMYAVEAPFSIYNRHKAKTNLAKADKAAESLWGERWADMREQMDNADPMKLANLLEATKNATDLDDRQKEAAFEYGRRLMQWQGYNSRSLLNQKESTDEANEIKNAYESGTELETPYDKHNAKLAVDRAEAALGLTSENSDEQQFAKMVISRVGVDSPVETINAMAEQGYSDEQIQKAKNYYAAIYRMNGLTDALLEDVDSQIESANNEVDANTNQENGSVTQVVLRNGGVGYVVQGTVVRGEKGAVDVNNSDDTIMVRLENGEIKMMNPNKDLVGVAWIESPETLKENNNTILKQDLLDKAIGEIDWNPATPNPKVGDSFEMDGVPVVVAGMNENGLVVVSAEEWQKAQGKKDYAFQTQSVVPVSAYKDWASAQLDAQEEATNAQQTDANNLQTEMQTESGETLSETPTEEGSMRGTVGSPVALAYLLEGGQGSIENLGYFLHGVAGAFPEVENEIEAIRGRIGAEGLGVSPNRFGEVASPQMNEMRSVIVGRYGEAGGVLFDSLVKNSTGFVPREGAKIAKQLESLEVIENQELTPVGKGVFGDIYDQFKGKAKEAIEFLKKKKGGEAIGALHHNEIGDIDLVWGKEGTGKSNGFGLSKLVKYHPEVLDNLQEILENMVVVRRNENRINLESDTHKAAIRLEWDGVRKNWLLTAFEKEMPTATDRTTDIGDTKLQNDTAPLQTDGISSENKDKSNNVQSQENQGDFVSMGKEKAFEVLGNKYGEKMPHKIEVTAKALAEDLRKAQQKLDKAEEDYDNAPIGREQKAEKARDKAREEFEAVKREADFWAEMDAEIKSAQVMPGDEAADEILSMEEPLNGLEFAAQMLANGNIKLLQESFMEETGFGREEAKKYFGLFASKEKGGVSVERAGERLMEADREEGTNFFDQNDANAGRDAIIEILGIARTKSDLANYIKDNREKQARKEQAAEYAVYESWVEENFHMSIQDYEAYEEVIARELSERALTEEEYQEFMSTFVDETINNEQYEQQGIDSESEGSSEILPGTQSLQAERTGGIEEESAEVDGGIVGENGAVPESSSGNEIVSQIEQARAEVDTNPTDAQKEAGNYKKGHVKIDGFDITIENPKGGVRSGTNKNGKKWSITMNNDYGYIRGTEAVDGDHIDVFLSDNPTEGNVFVVDQSNEDGSFDESKVMYGFSSLEEARAAYLSNYEKDWESRIMAITEVSKDEFKKWIDSSHRKTKAFSEYKSVKAEAVDEFPLSESEYADKRSEELMKENPDIDDIDAYNKALDEYPSYIERMIKSGYLEDLYAKSSIKDRITLGKIVQSAGFETSDISRKSLEKNESNNSSVGEKVIIRYFDGSLVEVVIEKADKGKITVRSVRSGRKYNVPEDRIVNKSTLDEDSTLYREGESVLQYAERVANEEARRRPLRQRAKEWSKALGVNVNFLESIDEVDARTRAQIESEHKKGSGVPGWVTSKGEVYFFMPDLRNTKDIDETYIHEVVAHIGMEKLLGKKRFTELCDKVWNMMPQSEKDYYEKKYPGVKEIKDETKRHRAAADEYIAHLAEKTNLTPEEQTIWDKIVKTFRELLDKALNGILSKSNITDEDLSNLIKMSYANLKSGNAENVGGEGTRFRTLEEINQAFNEELQQQIDGTLPNGHIYQLGSPSAVLQACGFPNMPIELSSTNLAEHSRKTRHSFELKDVKGLVYALQKPVAVFSYGDKKKSQNVIVEIQKNDRNFLIGVHFNQNRNGLEVSSIRGVFPKDSAEWLNWISQDKALYLNKEKIQDLILKQRKTLADVKYLDLDSVANIINSFENPTLPEEKTLFRVAYHGSAAEFDKFSKDFIGSGEGQSVMGHGFYVTTSEGTSEYYANVASENKRKIVQEGGYTFNGEVVRDRGLVSAYELLKDNNFDADKAIERANHRIEIFKKRKGIFANTSTTEKAIEYLEAEKNNPGSIGYQEEIVEKPSRVKYEVEIPDDTGKNYLDLDKKATKKFKDESKKRMIEVLDNGEEASYWKKNRDIINYEWESVDKNDATNDTVRGAMEQFISQEEVANIFSEMGYVGSKAKASDGTTYIIYNEDDIEIKGSTRFRIANQNQEIFVSNAQRVVEGIKQEKATPGQWLAMIEKNGGIKAGEDKWLGLSDWLKDSKAKSITKAEILDFIGENKIRIEEVHYGDANTNPSFESLKQEYDQWLREEGSDYAWNELIERFGDDAEIAFSDIGGELVVENEDAAATLLGGDNIINYTRLNYTTEGLENKHEIALTVPTIEPWNEDDETHFGDAGGGRAVAWIRFGETTDADGNRVLVIDEIQSKRHQEGREKGYKSKEIANLLKETEELQDKLYNEGLTEEDYERNREIRRRLEELSPGDGGYSNIPEAPFEKNWHELAMKRMLRYAAENGYDKVAWTTGEQQADRYNLSNVVERIQIKKFDDGYDVYSYAKDTGELIEHKTYSSEKELSDSYGQALAAELIKKDAANKTDNYVSVEGDGLKVGGEGMKGFYDKMLPSFVSKYVKKWGTKVQDIELPNVEEAGRIMHSVDITGAMKESVMEGQTMFRVTKAHPKNEVEVESDEDLQRKGEGPLTADEVSLANDPLGKVLRQPTRTAGQRKSFAQRERQRMVERVTSLAKKLGLKNVEIVTDASTLSGAQRKAKGFYSKSKRKITIVIPNHSSVFDAEQTLLHEAVGHYGLRELFGNHFDTFLNNVYQNASSEVRERINRLAMKNGWDFQKATEEYLASLAEDTNFEDMQESWWSKIKEYFLQMLHEIGFIGFRGVTLTDNELRYILWRSYENLAEPGRYRSILGEAADIAMQDKLKVGNYSQSKYERERLRLLASGLTNSSVAESAVPYTHKEQIEDLVEEFTSLYNSVPVHILDKNVSDKQLQEWTGVKDVSTEDFIDWLEEQKVPAVHVRTNDNIIIFADKIKPEKVEETLFHENLHSLLNNGAHKELVDKFYKSAKDDARFGKWKKMADKEQYDDYERPEEFFVYVVSNGQVSGNLEDVFEYLTSGEQSELKNLLNINGYDYDNRRRLVRQGTSSVRGTKEEAHILGNTQGTGQGKGTEGLRSVSNSDEQRRGKKEELLRKDRDGNSGDKQGRTEPNKESKIRSREESGTNEAGQEGVEDDNLYRGSDEVEGMSDDTARWLYEKSVKGNAYRFQEGFQDAMLSLKKLQEAIVKQVGGKLEEWEDAYTAENQMSSRDTSEIENFMFNHFNPMLDAVAKFLKKSGMDYEGLRTYLFAKSGLERNRDFAVRDAITQREKDGDDVNGIYEAYLQRKQELLQDLKDGTITFREYCEEMDNEAMMIAPDLMGRDYSGLSSLFGEDTFTEDAIAEVEQVENLANTDALWNAIKGATQFSLDRAKQSGVMSTDVHKKLSEMFEWYIPMRGWSETKARDVYDYFGRQEGVFNPTIKNAYGRKSLADDPLATIANMAESSIFQGNKNQMKQKLLNLAFDKPTNLITVMDSWIENKGTEDDPRWEYVYPPIEQDDDADVIAAKIKQFEEEMEQKKDAGVAKKLRGKADIPYIATPKEIAEHIIRVKRNGREFVMIINGNPRAAQAINGETNPETYNGIIEQVSRRLNRFMAAAFTTKNPTFIMRNLSRDLIFSNTAVAIKESNAYGKKFRGNQMKVLGNMRGLMKRYQSGKLDMNNPLDKMFQEFIQNGGETGFAQLTSVDEYKKKIQRELKDAKNRGKKISGKKVGRVVMDTIEFYNRCAEDVSRFTVYMTSRQMGRSIQRSVSDAKEITVNFNKRGSGSKAGGFIGFGAQSMRSLYLFFNAAVQALVNFKRLGQKHPIAFTTALSMYAVSGFLMPVVNEFLSSVLGGDDDDYENLPEWVRRNNLVISLGKWGGDAMFLTVPLPIEMRAFYGLGETSNQLLAGNVRGKDAAIQIAGQFAEMLPLNFVTDAAGPFNAFTPDAFKPIAQAYVSNKDWTGKPIYRDNGFNKELPEWTKAYAGTSKWLVNSAELLNELTGGDKYKSGVVDINPARLEHLFTGYLGGFGDMFLGGYKTISMLWDEDYRNVRNTPVLKAFLNQSDERTSYYQVKKDYASFKDEYEDTVRRLNGYERELKQPETALEYAERMDFLQRSPQIKRYEVMKTYEKELNKLYKEMKEFPDPEVQKAITTTINQIKSDAVTILREIK